MIKLSKIIISILLVAVVLSGCTSNNKVEPRKTAKQEETVDPSNAPIEDISPEDMEKMMEEMGAVNVAKYDAKEIEDYGQKVDVNGKKMNIYVAGEGSIPLVIFPGKGELSARYAYKNMLDILEKAINFILLSPWDMV